ncbi:MAG: hypothetical protein P1V81_13730 [Planctomycetota bacterium]|nr:hypothetical protein [Planctomycetota bacterium]
MNQAASRLAFLLPLLLALGCSPSSSGGAAPAATPASSAFAALLATPGDPSAAFGDLILTLAASLEAGTGDPTDALLLQQQLVEALSVEADFEALQAVAEQLESRFDLTHPSSATGQRVIFVPGAAQSPIDQAISAVALADAYARTSAPMPATWSLHYNPACARDHDLRPESGCLAGSFLASSLQLTKPWGFQSLAAEALEQALFDHITPASTGAGLGWLQALEVGMEEDKAKELGLLMGARPSDAEVADLRASIRLATESGDRVLVVAYSQGNRLARLALEALPAEDLAAVGVVAVAAPHGYGSLPHSFGSYQHVTAFGDLSTAVELFPEAEPPAENVTTLASLGVEGQGDYSNRTKVHALPGSYLLFPESRTAILDAIDAAWADLIPVEPALGQGSFQAMLTWDGTADLDLHIREATGKHVWFAQPIGDVGLLDLDGTDGLGPEHYFVGASEDLVVGEYLLWLEQHAGAAGDHATLSLAAGPSLLEVVVEATGPGAVIDLARLRYDGTSFLLEQL